MSNQVVLELPHRPGNPRNSEGSFVTLADGRILFAWTRYRGTQSSDEARADIATRSSADGGLTWSAHDDIIVANEGDQNVMSVTLLRLQDGRIALFYLRKNSDADCRPYMRVSTDEAATWSEPVLCATEHGYCDLLNDQAVQLRSGRILLPADYRPQLGGCRSAVLCFISDDAGRTWRTSRQRWAPATRVNPLLAEPVVIELADGTLHCYARTGLHRQYLSTSPDQGETWTPPRPSRFRSARAPMNIKRLLGTGHLLAVWNDLTPRWGVPRKKLLKGWADDPSWGRTPLVLAISRDEGRTWRHAQAIETDPDRGFCYAALHVTGDALLLAYCCGGANRSHVLQDLRLRRLPLTSLYP